MKDILFTQLKIYVNDLKDHLLYVGQSLEDNSGTFWHLLVTIGKLLREKLSLQDAEEVGNVQGYVVDNLDIFVANISEYLKGCNLVEVMKSVNLFKYSGPTSPLNAMMMRDDFELVIQQLGHLLDEKIRNSSAPHTHFKLDLLSRLKRIAWDADCHILFNKRKVAAFQALNKEVKVNIPYYWEDSFRETFWWFGNLALRDYKPDPAYETTCHLPSYFQCGIIAQYQGGYCKGSIKRVITNHLKGCLDCQGLLTAIME